MAGFGILFAFLCHEYTNGMVSAFSDILAHRVRITVVDQVSNVEVISIDISTTKVI